MPWSQVTPQQRKTLVAAALGWMLDGFDVMLYATAVSYVMRDLGMSKPMAGFLNTLTLIASGLGGVMFGFIADRMGRKRALMLSILTYSVCSFASGLSTSIAMLAVFRFILGLGMGGEWNTGATLVAETWPTELRARALAMVQSSFAIGFAGAALVAGLVLKFSNWRTVFFVGIAPALVILWIRRQVPESEMWQEHHRLATASHRVAQAQKHYEDSSFRRLFSRQFIKPTFVLLFVNFFGMFGWWGLFTWAPAFLSLSESQGGRGFNLAGTTTMLIVQQLVGMFPGYFSFGWIADKFGRRRSFLIYLVLAAILTPIYAIVRGTGPILLLGILVAFFGTGFFSGSSITGSEVFPTTLRARALGFTYPGARMLSSVAPFAIGWTWQHHGLNAAFFLCGASFLLAAIVATQLPETKGKVLE
jgi:MFS family permease